MQHPPRLTEHFVLVDASRVTSHTSEARRAAVDDGARMTRNLRAVAFVEANFQFRVVGLLINKALMLLNRQNPYPIHFFDDETKARAWIAEQRSPVAR